MYLENLVFDAADPQRLGRFWEAALGAETLTDDADGFETRLSIPGGPALDLCFQPVAEPATAGPRLHLDLYGGPDRDAVVERLLGLGARHLDIGQGDVPWVVLADPEGNAFCVMEERAAYSDTGPIAALPLDSADPDRDLVFWQELSGWVPADGVGLATLRHPSRRGLLLELCPEPEPKTVKNRLHLDLRLEADDDPRAVVERAEELGATRVDHGWGAVPWTVLTDPSGNELCLLPAREPGR